MATNPMTTILTELNHLNNFQIEHLYKLLEEKVLSNAPVTAVINEVRERRFSNGKKCPHCNNEHVVRNGKFKGKQRYLCRNCNKSFCDFTASPVAYSKKTLNRWLEFAKCMVLGYSLRKSAEIVGIHLSTAFYWRHKISDGLRAFIGRGNVSGIVEVDETFFLESFKGNHKKSRTFTMPRPSRKRGGKSKFKGISHEQVCVVCAIDRNGNIISELTCKGRIRHSDLERVFLNHISKDSILCSDAHKSYIRFAQNLNIELIQLKSGKSKKGIYHIQHINSFHNELKKWIRRFNGVATKYLANYLYWFKWIKYTKDSKDALKSKKLYVQSATAINRVIVKDFKTRTPLFV